MEGNRLFKLYRSLLRQSKQIKDPVKRLSSVNELKTAIRSRVYPSSGGEVDVEELVKFCESRLGYLKIVSDTRGKTVSGKTNYKMVNGKLIEGLESVPRGSIKSGIDPDDLAKHQYLLERQHFMHRK